MNGDPIPEKLDVQSKMDSTDNTATRRGPGTPWHGIPWDVVGRIGLLFTTLCLLKLAILFRFRKHLYHVHWRIGETPTDWLGWAAFYLFVVLVGLNLWYLGKGCASHGARAVRVANAGVLALGLVFIFLMFHAGDKNYIYAALNGILSWRDISSYLSLALFFQKPFLAAWLFAYVLIYYGLARTGREHLALYFTSVCAVVYLLLFLEGLAGYRDALLVADCLGVICLSGASLSRLPLSWFCALQPVIWLGFFFAILRNQDISLEHLNPECAIITGGGLVLFGGLSALAWRQKINAAWVWVLPFAFASFLLLTNINYPLAINFRNLFLLGFTLPRYFLGEFFLSLVLLCVATLYRRWLPRGSLLWLDGISAALITLTVVDLRLSQIMGIRFDWQAIAFGGDMRMVWLEAQPFLPETLAGFIFLMVIYALIVGMWQRGPSSRSLQLGASGWFLLAVFLALGLLGKGISIRDKAEGQTAVLLAETNPLVKSITNPVMDRKTLMDTARQLHLDQMFQRPAASPERPLRRLNVVLIFQESTYNKYLSLFDGKVETQPLLSRYNSRMELFPNFFSNFADSISSRFGAFSGLYPVRDYKQFTMDRVNVKSIFDILSGAGYQTSVFYSSYLDYTGFREFLQDRGIKTMYDADNMPGPHNKPSVTWGLSESETVSAIQAQIKDYATNHQTFFLTYIPVAPHNPFDGVPKQFQKYKSTMADDYTPYYLNDLLYMDSCITSILDQLKTSGLLDHTLVIITDDHGEMLGENGGPIGHGWSTRPDLTNIPLIIMDPDNPGYHVNDTIGSQVDLLPTMLDLLGLPVPKDQLYEGSSLYSATARADRMIYLNSFQQFGVLEGNRYVSGNREIMSGVPTDLSSVKVYGITNEAARAGFPVLPTENVPLPSIDQFDQFQENFLKNYSQYCQMIRN